MSQNLLEPPGLCFVNETSSTFRGIFPHPEKLWLLVHVPLGFKRTVGKTDRKDMVITKTMIFTPLLNPDMGYWYMGWQMASYLSMEKARMVRTEA